MFRKRGASVEYKGFFQQHRLAIAATTLIGTIVGAGMLGIPYAVAKVGFLYGFLLILGVGLAFLVLNLFLGEIVLRTKEQHQLPGYAGRYLGIWGKRVMAFSMLIGLYGALTAYLIGEGTTWYALLGFGSPLFFILLFFCIVAFIIIRGIKATGKAELFLISLLFLVVLLIGFFSYSEIKLSNLTTLNFAEIFLPYGVILFAFVGIPAIPELQEELGPERKKLKKAILIGSSIPIVLYLLFTFIIIGIVGLDQFELLAPNQRIATVALSLYSSPVLGIFANLLAALAMFTSFLTIGLAMVEIYQYDYGVPRRIAILLTLFIPLLITLFNVTSFISILALAGAIGGGLDGILLVLMYWKARLLGNRTPEYSLGPQKILGTMVLIFFTLGLVYSLLASFS